MESRKERKRSWRRTIRRGEWMKFPSRVCQIGKHEMYISISWEPNNRKVWIFWIFCPTTNQTRPCGSKALQNLISASKSYKWDKLFPVLLYQLKASRPSPMVQEKLFGRCFRKLRWQHLRITKAAGRWKEFFEPTKMTCFVLFGVISCRVH